MFEGLAAWVLNMYIGEYLENLITEQLSIDLLQGQIELENVPFKKTALSKFNAAICIRSGILGKLTLTIPLTRLRSEPWVVKLHDIDVVLEPNLNKGNEEPNGSKEYDKEKESEKLRTLEEQDDLDNDNISASKDAQGGGGWWGYGAVANIVENIQLIVTNARIRYVDEVSMPGQTFACGIEIERFTIQTTDCHWKPGFVVRDAEETSYKLFQFFGLNLYWDNSFNAQSQPQNEFRGRFLTEASLDVRLEKRFATNPDDEKTKQTCYNVFTKFANVLKLNFDQLQMENIKLTLQNVTKWYFGEVEENLDHNSVKFVPNVDAGESGTASDMAVVATFDMPAVNIELRNCLGESDGRPFVLCQSDSLILKYVKDKIHISHIEACFGSIRVKDLLMSSSTSSNLQYLLSTTQANEGKFLDNQSYLSSSCPELANLDDSDYILLSSSLPGALSPCSYPSKIQQFSTAPVTPKLSRKTSLRADPLARFKITFIDAFHKDLETQFNKVQCQIEADFGNLEVVVNQETWVLLFDFFGLLTPSINDESKENERAEIKRQIEVKTDTLTVLLNVPKDRRLLAKMMANDFRATVLTENAGIEIFGKISGLVVEDCLAHLYSERINIRASEKDLEFVLYKYTKPDFEQKREFDAVLSVTSPEKCTYVHTQRFLVEFTSFWLQYVQLQEYYSRAREASLGVMLDDKLSHGFRLKLTANFNKTTVVLPEYSSSTKSLIVETESLTINNYFRFANSLESAKFYDETDDFNCLQDVMEIKLNDCALYVGSLTLTDDEWNNRPIFKNSENLLDKLCDVDVTFVRNLDSSISRNVPDMEIHMKFNQLVCQLHSSTYKIIRNLLEKNLGEEIPQTSGGVQSQFRTNPATVTVLSGHVWRNILLTIDLFEVVFVCRTDIDDNFGRIDVGRAHFSFENFSDSTVEVDFVCYSGSLIDTRYENLDEAVNKRRNVFSTIFGSKNDASPIKNENVVAEIHFYSHKEISKFTLLFSLARLVVVLDWLALAKTFILSRSEPCVKEKPRRLSMTPASLIRAGVARKSFEYEKMKADNFEMKINFTESEIIFVENTSCRNSLATVLKGTSVINFKEHEYSTNFSCNANSLQIFNCTMDNRRDMETTLTEPFNLTVDLTPIPKKGPSVKLVPVGLLDLGHTAVDHKMEVTLCNVVAKFSYHDWLVFKSVLDSYTIRFGAEPDEQTSNSGRQTSMSLDKIETKISSVCLWLLDDSQDHRMPLLRITMKNAEFEQKPTKLLGESKEGFGFCNFSVDFFNQNVYGWEPLLEPWKLQNFCWTYFPRLNSLNLAISCMHEVLNINISRIFLDQLSNFIARWPKISHTASTDFRTSYVKRSDFLPYELRNDTGSQLMFTVETSKIPFEKSQNVKIDWITVEHDKSASFSFRSLPQFDDNLNSLNVDKIVVRIDGWHEIGAINVDSVGTYFRLTRLNETNRNVSGLAPANPTYAQVVIAVTKDNEGRKLITIRSSLLFVNALSEPLEVYLENTSTYVGDFHAFLLQPGAVRPAPLRYTMCRISVRPKGVWSVGFCKPISWQHVSSPGQVSDCFRQCTTQDQSAVYKLCVSIKREHFPDTKRYVELNSSNIVTLPGHTITFVSPLIVVNLLPTDVKIKVNRSEIENYIVAGDRHSITVIDIREQVELNMSIENFYTRESLKFTPAMIQEERIFYVEMFDNNKRPFILTVFALPIKGGGIKVSLSSPFWIVNKSGLPLIFKQEGSSEEAAGQFDEHESGKSMFPAIFSFADTGSPKQLALRLGRFTHHSCKPFWCNSFVLDPGITCKTLQLQKFDGSPSLLYNVGVEVRVGQGLYKDTRIVMLTALYTLDNRSNHKLFVSQKCDVDSKQISSTISPNCSMAWHWSRQDLDTLLCVKRSDILHWSNGFRIDQLTSFHLTIRDDQGMPHLLRVEIVLHGAMYFVTFLDADTFPAPIRIENLSEVPILYQQKGCDASHLRTILRPHSEVNYSWDDQLQPKLMVLTIYGNKSIEYDMTVLGQHCPLTYENYFYIAFSATFDRNSHSASGDDVELVLDVLPKGKVILHKKDASSATQLWRMSADGMLVNVAMSRSDRDNHSESSVLDILNLSDPKKCVPLMLHRPDHRRRLTQRWNFTEDGRLMCGLQGLYVQASDGQLKTNVAAVLGPTQGSAEFASGIAVEQLICKIKQKPGSGSLLVTVSLDGPTRVLRITDVTNPYNDQLTPRRHQRQLENALAAGASSSSSSSPPIAFQFCCSFNLEALSFSIITSQYEELLYCQMRGLHLQLRKENLSYSLFTSILDMQADNQLLKADRWTLLYIRPKYDEKGEPSIPAVEIIVSWTPLPSYDSFESFVVRIGKAALFLEEYFLWKLVTFLELDVPASVSQSLHSTLSVGYKPPNIDIERPDPQKARRVYFDNLSLSCRRLYLSVLTANSLPPELRRAKQRWNVPLVRFENAPVEIEPFQQMYYFETLNFLLDAFGKHLQVQLTSQAVKILGTVDFLGNPLGLFQDVSGGLRELFIEGNVSGFVRGVWHGVSNSTAKITSSVSEGVGKISMDEKHRQMREQFRHSQSNSADPLGHLMTGVKGLGIGILGGVFSVPTNMYDGARKDGLEGFIIGTGKGFLGVVTKPVQGFLDLATGAATAAKEIVSTSGPPTAKFPSCRLRPSRVTRSVQGTLPPYSPSLAAGQEALRAIRDHNNEICLAMYLINAASNGETLYVLVSSELVYVVKKRSTDDQEIVLTVKYSDMKNCSSVVQTNANAVGINYLEFLSNAPNSYSKNGKPKKSLVKCSSSDIAVELSRQIMHAKQQFDDQQRSLPVPEDVSVEI